MASAAALCSVFFCFIWCEMFSLAELLQARYIPGRQEYVRLFYLHDIINEMYSFLLLCTNQE